MAVVHHQACSLSANIMDHSTRLPQPPSWPAARSKTTPTKALALPTVSRPAVQPSSVALMTCRALSSTVYTIDLSELPTWPAVGSQGVTRADQSVFTLPSLWDSVQQAQRPGQPPVIACCTPCCCDVSEEGDPGA